MSSKRDKLRNAMSKSIFNYGQNNSTPVNDIIDALPENLDNNVGNANDAPKTNESLLDAATSEISVELNETTTSVMDLTESTSENSQNSESVVSSEADPLNVDSVESDTDKSSANNLDANNTSESSNSANNKTDLSSETNDIKAEDIQINTSSAKDVKEEASFSTTEADAANAIANEETEKSISLVNKDIQEEQTSIVNSSVLELFRDDPNNSNNDLSLDNLSSVKNYFANKSKAVVVPMTLRIERELDVFSKIEAYKNNITLNMYYNYIILKDMQKNTDTKNYNPIFDLNNDTLYKKTSAYNSTNKTFSIIPELKEYLTLYGAKLGVTCGNYFKYILRKEYEQSENNIVN